MTTVKTTPWRIPLTNGDVLTIWWEDETLCGSREFDMEFANGNRARAETQANAQTLDGLLLALYGALEMTRTVRQTLDYIRSTDWGAKLP